MSKRYKEFLIDVIIKAYQLVFGLVIVSPLVTKTFDIKQLIIGLTIVLLLLIWAGAISAKLEG